MFMCWNRRNLIKSVVTVVLLFAFSQGMAATLIGGFVRLPKGTNVNLTTAGAIDWVHWGLHTETSLDRKANVTPQINDWEMLGMTNGFLHVYQYSDNPNGYSWSDGTPNASVTNTTTGVYAYGFPSYGAGFELTVPSDTTLKTLKVFVGVFSASAQFEASLSDSTSSYVDSSMQAIRGTSNAVYIIQFASDSPGQILTIRYTTIQTFVNTGNTTLQSAALTAAGADNPPAVSITSPALNSKYTNPTNIIVAADAQDFDGSVSRVEFYDNGEKIGEDATSPYSINWSPQVGYHSLTAIATDNEGVSVSSPPVDIFVNGFGGSLTGSTIKPPNPVNLTLEGTIDWGHWGLMSSNDFTHKAGVTQQISNLLVIGSAPLQRYTNNLTRFSWSDGTPVTTVTNTRTGIFVYRLGSGFELEAPADTTPRRLKVYAGLYGARGNLQAYLSDFSAPAYTDTAVSTLYEDTNVVFTIDYAAASSDQQLIVRYRSLELYDFDFGNVTLQAATLSSTTNVVAPIWILDPQRNGNEFRFSFDTQAGKGYRAQFNQSFDPTMWQTFTNLTGNGNRVTITNRLNGSPDRFYRVAQP